MSALEGSVSTEHDGKVIPRQPAFGQYADPAFSALELAAIRWLDGFYQLEHLLCARVWTMRLMPAASPELRFAALVHDAERFFAGGPSNMPENGFDDPDYLFVHSMRSADIVEAWLRKEAPGQDETFIRRVRRLVLRHEIGGGWEADLLQAADSLSFLETFDWLVLEWVNKGYYTLAGAREKLDWMFERMRPPMAIQPALSRYAHALRLLDSPTDADVDFAKRRRIAGCRIHLLGLNP
jgi:hypothetical protein